MVALDTDLIKQQHGTPEILPLGLLMNGAT